ncbi:MAG: hypothetical protein OEM82_10870 [Acidobacteriota bacterium]|nr:hypothetical protein [Acidobacteriota bacterium]MDH3530298.1 hypothetical protein [Acidobacteriota bacterium]
MEFLPFGEEIGSTVGSRSGFQYSPNGDDVRQKFTGYLKDEETGLDFAEARMYENRHGRFTAVDPLLASGNSTNPQTFNRFIYVMNSPVGITDPTGECPRGGCDAVHFGTVYRKKFENGEYRYNNEQEDDTWEVFEGEAIVNRADDNIGGFAMVNAFGWYPMSTEEVVDYLTRKMNANFDNMDRLGSPPSILWQFGQMFEGMGKSTLNAPIGFSNTIYSGINAVSGPFTPKFPITENWQPENSIQRNAMFGTDMGLLGVSLFSGNLTANASRPASFSGFSGRPTGTTSFSESLFHSKTFGKESRLFGNSIYDSTGAGRAGLLNRKGSRFKIGWGKDRAQPLSITNDNFGAVFRIGRGTAGNTNIANKHYYFPRTFIPESRSNLFQYRTPKSGQ